MADVFISYAREDQPRAEQLAAAIAVKGWTVWWDRRIQVGKSFSRVIDAELDAARCVLVLWSRKSVESDWVLTEAAEGAQRKILVPVAVEADVRIPLEFRRLQTANLIGWRPEVANADFDACIAAIESLVPPSAPAPAPAQTAPPVPQPPETPAVKLAPPVRSPKRKAKLPPDPPTNWPLPLLEGLSFLLTNIWGQILIAVFLVAVGVLVGFEAGLLKPEMFRLPFTPTAPVKTTTTATTTSMPLADRVPGGVDFETSAGIISFELASKEREVDRFVALVQKGVYDGSYFQRSPNGVVVLGNLDSADRPWAQLSGQPHEKGTLSIPLKEPSRRLTTLMFVCLNDSPPSSLDEQFAVIGRVRSGSELAVVERIARENRDVVIHQVRLH